MDSFRRATEGRHLKERVMTMRLANETIRAEETWAGVMPVPRRAAMRAPRWLQWLGRMAGVLPAKPKADRWPPAQDLAAALKEQARREVDGIWPKFDAFDVSLLLGLARKEMAGRNWYSWSVIVAKLESAAATCAERRQHEKSNLRLVPAELPLLSDADFKRKCDDLRHDVELRRASMDVADLDAPDPYDMAM